MGGGAPQFHNPEWEKARQALEKVQGNNNAKNGPPRPDNPNFANNNPNAQMYYQHMMYYQQYVIIC